MSCRGRIESVQIDVESSEAQLRRLRSSFGDSLAIFGKQMKDLVQNIQRNQREFQYLPIGPLGSKIKLRDYKWSIAVEQLAKKNLLHAFIADNHRDAGKLKSMINSVYVRGPKPEVIVSPYQDTVYDVRRNVSCGGH